MKKIERRAALCLILALFLLLGLCLFAFRFVTRGGDWAAFPSNRHLYDKSGHLIAGEILDCDGDMLSTVKDGKRTYYPDSDVRKATLHAVGDPAGNIGTGALHAFADKLSGYNLLTGGYSPLGTGHQLTLTIDAYLNVIAYNALGGQRGAVGVYNYKTGETLCMVSTPTFDPADPPEIDPDDERYEGVYLNRFLSGSIVPGSVFKTVTLHAALERIPDIHERTWTCTGSTTVGGVEITCPHAHGDLDIDSAFANSCNGVFGELAAEMGADVMKTYTEKSGLTTRYSVDGIKTAAGSFRFDDADRGALGWAGVGQGGDAVNPCALMTYMGAVANGGKAAEPRLIKSLSRSINLRNFHTSMTGTLIEPATAQTLAAMMRGNVEQTYGADRFPAGTAAKSGTAEVGGGKAPNAWFTGFISDPDHPYAFVVVVENGGGGAAVAGKIAAKVLNAAVEKF